VNAKTVGFVPSGQTAFWPVKLSFIHSDFALACPISALLVSLSAKLVLPLAYINKAVYPILPKFIELRVENVSIWGKIIGGVAGFAVGGPLGAILGVGAGHAVDKIRGQNQEGQYQDGQPGGIENLGATKQVAFTVAIIVLSAKMAKADGQVTRDEVDAFKEIFRVPDSEMKGVGLIFDKAKKSADGFEPYAEQIAKMFSHEPAVLEELLGGLFHIANADGVIHPGELAYLQTVSDIFGFGPDRFERVKATYAPAQETSPYEILGIAADASDDEIKKVYRALIRENHPDTVIAQGMPQEFVDLANEKMATINAAYDDIRKKRGLS